MVVIDEFTRECLAIYVARRIRARDALEVFADLMKRHGVPRYILSEKGPEMIAKRGSVLNSVYLVRPIGVSDTVRR